MELGQLTKQDGAKSGALLDDSAIETVVKVISDLMPIGVDSWLEELRREKPELAMIVDGWDSWPEAIRAGMVALAKTADSAEQGGT